jgi:CRISPR-associated protein Cas1
MRTLHELPRFSDRWSYLYLEHGELDQQANGLVFHNTVAFTSIPIDQLGLLMLGPGTTVTHAAVKALAANNCLVAWVGEEGVRMYAHSTGGTFSARRLLSQARQATEPELRLRVVKRLYGKRFPDDDLTNKTLEQIRGMEGARVRAVYARLASEHGVAWAGRNYDQGDWNASDPVNRALSAANACLYGVTHAAIVSAGYSAGLGFIHTGKLLSFVYDVADLYKTEVTVPVAFRVVAAAGDGAERRVRLGCRDAFREARLLDRILPDIAEVLGDACDDRGAGADELEGRAVSMAGPSHDWGVLGQPESPSSGRTLGESSQESQDGECDSDLGDAQ